MRLNLVSLNSGSVDRFWSKVIVDCACDCWIWVGSRRKDGYGQFAWGNHTPKLAHRVAYETWRGEIAANLEIDHLCRVRACVNPWHLETVDRLTNFVRGAHPMAVIYRSGLCRRGHERSGANLGADGHCLTCRRQGRRDLYPPKRGNGKLGP